MNYIVRIFFVLGVQLNAKNKLLKALPCVFGHTEISLLDVYKNAI
jgi:hypothetical protein